VSKKERVPVSGPRYEVIPIITMVPFIGLLKKAVSAPKELKRYLIMRRVAHCHDKLALSPSSPTLQPRVRCT
jgi:hypothetical protein